MPTHASKCVLNLCVRSESRYLPSTLIEPFRNPPNYVTHIHTHAKRVQPAGSLCLARCSRLCCQMNHLQITGVAIAGEKNNTAAPTAWEGEGETKNQLLVEESTQEWDKITHNIKQHLIVDVFSSSSLRKKVITFLYLARSVEMRYIYCTDTQSDSFT